MHCQFNKHFIKKNQREAIGKMVGGIYMRWDIDIVTSGIFDLLRPPVKIFNFHIFAPALPLFLLSFFKHILNLQKNLANKLHLIKFNVRSTFPINLNTILVFSTSIFFIFIKNNFILYVN